MTNFVKSTKERSNKSESQERHFPFVNKNSDDNNDILYSDH